MMNMLVGVLVEVIKTVSEIEREQNLGLGEVFFFDVRQSKKGPVVGCLGEKKGDEELPSYNGDYDEPL